MKHGLRSIKQGRLTEAFTIIAAESAKQLGSEDLAKLTREFEASVGDVVMTLTTSGYSRTQERDADFAAVQLLRRAGYPEAAMITMLRCMDERLADAGGLGFAKTHPSAKSRENSLRSTVTSTTYIPDTVRQERFSATMRIIMTGS
jgi:predicted Zn-dependent protease